MEWWHVYLFTRLDSLNCTITMLGVILGVLLVIVGVIAFVSWTDIQKEHRLEVLRVIKTGALCFIGSLVLGVVVPTQKEAAAIYLLPKLVNSDFAKEAGKLPADAAKLLHLKMEEWITELTPAPSKEDAKGGKQ